MTRAFHLILFFTAFTLALKSQPRNYIFKNGKEGYRMYRIPALVQTKSGLLLAFCEGRQSLRDHGNIDLVMKTSADSGKTWGALQLIYSDGKNTCGNPSPVVESATGVILLTATINNRSVIVFKSSDEGKHWSNPMDVTASVKPSDWNWYATGPVHGIQISQGVNKGRIVVPCNHTLKNSSRHISHIIYSDDMGTSWHLGGSVNTEGTDECTVAELPEGNLLLNMRNTDRQLPCRKTSISKDGGLSWSTPAFDSTLIEPVCQGALLSHPQKRNVLCFTNPANSKVRKDLTLRFSFDSGKSWKKEILIQKGPCAYSDITLINHDDLYCIYETGKLWPYGGIAGKKISAH
ncbi:MAG: sialidase family protein [Chitinophagales bacterium]